MKFDFPNNNGERLSGVLELPEGKPTAFALFAHCFTCSKDSIAAFVIAKTLRELGIGVLRFDFTGLGDSMGDFVNTNFSSNVADLLSACEALQEQYKAPEILIGHSLGGAAVLRAATQLADVKAVVTIAAPSSTQHLNRIIVNEIPTIEEHGKAEVSIAGRHFILNKQFVDDISGTDVLDGISKFRKALLVMHAPHDDTVSIDHAAEIFQTAKHPKSFVSLDNGDHLLSRKSDGQYAAKVIAAWVERYVTSYENVEQEQGVTGKVRVVSRMGAKFTQDIYSEDHHLIADEPVSVQGDNLGMNPYELLLAGLGACTSMTMRMYADRKKIPLESVDVLLSHDKIHAVDCESCETQSGKIDRIVKSIRVSGDLTPENKHKLYEIAEKCPVNRTLKAEIFIESHHPEGEAEE